MRVWVDNVAPCPKCGCEETALVFGQCDPPALVCSGCFGHWRIEFSPCEESPGEEGPRRPADAQ